MHLAPKKKNIYWGSVFFLFGVRLLFLTVCLGGRSFIFAERHSKHQTHRLPTLGFLDFLDFSTFLLCFFVFQLVYPRTLLSIPPMAMDFTSQLGRDYMRMSNSTLNDRKDGLHRTKYSVHPLYSYFKPSPSQRSIPAVLGRPWQRDDTRRQGVSNESRSVCASRMLAAATKW